MTDLGDEYTGTLSRTYSNVKCESWSGTHFGPADFPDASVQDAHNYCRNPDKDAGGPWCFISDRDPDWQYCDVACCPTGKASTFLILGLSTVHPKVGDNKTK